MTRTPIIAIVLILASQTGAADIASNIVLKEAVVSSIDTQSAALVDLSDQIWAHAEIALHETQSAKVLADYAEQQGFRVDRGIAGMPMAFIASYGKGKPIIGVLGALQNRDSWLI